MNIEEKKKKKKLEEEERRRREMESNPSFTTDSWNDFNSIAFDSPDDSNSDCSSYSDFGGGDSGCDSGSGFD